MKKLASLLAIVLFVSGSFYFTGCIEEDLTNPVITLLGDNPMTIEFGTAFTDPGATALDDIDGDLTTSILSDPLAVDVNMAGEYDVVYSVTDAAGNTAQETRKVYVTHTSANIAGNYDVSEDCSVSGQFSYTTGGVIQKTGGTKFEITFTNFGDYVNTINVEGELTGNDGKTISIPLQIDVNGTDINIEGTGTVNSEGTILTIDYTATQTSDPTQSETCTAVWTKQ